MSYPSLPIPVDTKTFPQFCTTLGVSGIIFVLAMTWHLDSLSHRAAVASQLTMTAFGCEIHQRIELAHQLAAAKFTSQKRQIASDLQLETGNLSKVQNENMVAMGNFDIAMHDLTSFLRQASQVEYLLVAFFSVGLVSWSFQASREIFGQPAREYVNYVTLPIGNQTGAKTLNLSKTKVHRHH